MRTRDEHSSSWVLDLREPEVLSAWRAVAARLKVHCRPDGPAALLLDDTDAGPKSTGGAGVPHQSRTRLPMLVSSTREIDIFGALNAALPLVATSREPMSSWRDFLAGYACGLKTSPSLDIRRVRFLCEFDNAITATTSHSCVAAHLSRAASRHPGDGCLWTCTILEAISYGSTTLASLLAHRAMSAGRASSADAMLGALLGSALWRGCPYESDLIGHLCGSAPNSSSRTTHWPYGA